MLVRNLGIWVWILNDVLGLSVDLFNVLLCSDGKMLSCWFVVILVVGVKVVVIINFFYIIGW